jgi:hypothetical protein
MIPEDIVTLFAEEALKNSQVIEEHGKNMIAVNNYVLGAKFAYSFRDSEIELLETTIDNLHKLMVNAEQRGVDKTKEELEEKNKLIDLKETERRQWADMCIKKQTEIERLKGLLEKEFKENNGYDLKAVPNTNTYDVFQTDELKEIEWQQFLAENKL